VGFFLEYGNLSIKTLRSVYEPSDDSTLAAMAIESALAKIKGKISVLDVGTGTGILGLVAGTNQKVKRLTFGDIDPVAVTLAQKNYLKNRELIGAKCRFVKTDLFSRINGKFDLIVFNAPYLPADENTNSKALNRALNGGEDGMEVCIQFMSGLKAHLSRNGKALMVISSFGNLRRMRSEAVRLGLRTKTVAKQHIFFEDIIVVEIKVA